MTVLIKLPMSRRAVFAMPTLYLSGHAVSSAKATDADESSDWPNWAPRRRDLYAKIEAHARAEGRDLRSFGAALDGRTDDSLAFERAIAAGVRVLVIPATVSGAVIRLARQIVLTRAITIMGSGDSPLIRWDGKEPSPFFARPPGDEETSFVEDIHLDGLQVMRPDSLPVSIAILSGHNMRRVSLTRCSSRRMGGLMVKHMREANGRYKRTAGSATLDPAVMAGFSAEHTDDLNEEIFVFDNKIDGGAYMSNVVRFNFSRKIAVVGNEGRFANISWWGGGARHTEGGSLGFQRRVREVYITNNRLSGANGGIYGNNGDGILVAHNDISLMTDVGIDFEGCFNALAYNNIVRNVGNFCYATFYAAKNIVFRDNYGMQDGDGTNLHLVYGKGRYGRMAGRALLALRSAGFGNVAGAIDVSFIDNHFVWAGPKGLGNCVPSYFNRLRLEGNRFENVECNLAYTRTGELEVMGNKLSFDRTGDAPIRILGSSANRTLMVGNEIRNTAAQKPGSLSIFDKALSAHHACEIRDNRLFAPPAAGGLPMVLEMTADIAADYIVTNNQLPSIHASRPSNVQAKNNRNLDGKAVKVTPIPTDRRHDDKA